MGRAGDAGHRQPLRSRTPDSACAAKPQGQYPLIPIDEYVTWTRGDGKLFNAWMRVHSELGATVVRPCPRSMRIVGNVADWEEWTGVQFPGSGQYIVPGPLVPVLVDRELTLASTLNQTSRWCTDCAERR